MKRTGPIFALLLALAGYLPAAQTGLHREGEFWVETTTGSETMGDGQQLKILCLGNVVVRGGGHSKVDWTVQRKFRARSEAEARERLQEAGVSLTRQGGYAKLVVNDVTGPVELQLTVPRNLRMLLVGTDAGTVDVGDLDGSVRAETSGGDIKMTKIHGDLDVNTAGGSVRLTETGGSAHATTAGGDIIADWIGGGARLDTGGGDITVQKVGGQIRATTAGGLVRIGQSGGAIVADTAGGSIDIGRAGGTVVARNAGGGPIEIASATGGVRCESASGAIKVASSGSLRLSTAAGTVVAQFLGDKVSGDSYLSTGSGDITVFIPAKLSITIRAQNDGAARARSIVSDFSDLQVRFDGGTAVAQGALNGGGPTLHIEGNGGMIFIRRK